MTSPHPPGTQVGRAETGLLPRGRIGRFQPCSGGPLVVRRPLFTVADAEQHCRETGRGKSVSSPSQEEGGYDASGVEIASGCELYWPSKGCAGALIDRQQAA